VRREQQQRLQLWQQQRWQDQGWCHRQRSSAAVLLLLLTLFPCQHRPGQPTGERQQQQQQQQQQLSVVIMPHDEGSTVAGRC
jgi:hypothetical protein